MKTTNENRKLVIEAYVKGSNRKTIASMFNIRYHTVCAILKIYEKEGRYEKKLKGGARHKKLSVAQISEIKSWIDDDCGITLKYIKHRVYDKFKVDISLKTVERYVHTFEYTIKRAVLIPEKRNISKNLELRHEYATWYYNILASVSEQEFIYVDEVGFNVSMRSKRGRSLIGTPASHIVPGIRTRNISVCCAMTIKGILKFSTQTCAFKTSSFSDFIDLVLEKLNEINLPKAVIILDNVPFHKHISIRSKFDETTRLLKYLPPYSPFLNPIENMFSKWKNAIRQLRPRNEQHLFELIDTAADTITSDDCAAYFRNIYTFLPKCINREDILNGN